MYLKYVESEKMLTSSVMSDAIILFVTRLCQKSKISMKIDGN